jgi:hypothetical protein
MLNLLALLLALVVHVPADLLARLDSPSFRVREQATRDLRDRLTWPVALHLSLDPPSRPEARARALALVEEYFAIAIDPRRAPHIDALTNPACSGCQGKFTEHYLARAMAAGKLEWMGEDNLRYFRHATVLLVMNLCACRVPPALIRAVLRVMDLRTKAWEARMHHVPRPEEP